MNRLTSLLQELYFEPGETLDNIASLLERFAQLDSDTLAALAAADDTHSGLRELALAAQISLAVARGSATPLLSSALTLLRLTADKDKVQLHVPSALQIIAKVAKGASQERMVVPKPENLAASWNSVLPVAGSVRGAVCDGSYLFVYLSLPGEDQLLKFGTGYAGTEQGVMVASASRPHPDGFFAGSAAGAAEPSEDDVAAPLPAGAGVEPVSAVQMLSVGGELWLRSATEAAGAFAVVTVAELDRIDSRVQVEMRPAAAFNKAAGVLTYVQQTDRKHASVLRRDEEALSAQQASAVEMAKTQGLRAKVLGATPCLLSRIALDGLAPKGGDHGQCELGEDLRISWPPLQQDCTMGVCGASRLNIGSLAPQVMAPTVSVSGTS